MSTPRRPSTFAPPVSYVLASCLASSTGAIRRPPSVRVAARSGQATRGRP
jgi:hypothetical protein